MTDLKFCTRTPLEGDALSAMCPACPHAIGFHAEGYCPACAIVAHVGAMASAVEAHALAFTTEVAVPVARVLDTIAKQFASMLPAISAALEKADEEKLEASTS